MKKFLCYNSILIGVIMAVIGLQACSGLPVTFRGEPVDNERVVRAANAIHDAERLAIGILQNLQDAVMAEPADAAAQTHFRRYVETVAPGVQLGLDTSREALMAYMDGRDGDDGARLRRAMAALAAVVQQAEVFVATGGSQ